MINVNVKRFLLSSYTVAVIVSLLALWLRFLLAPVLQENAPLLVFILPVMLSAWYGGWRSGLLATVLCALMGTYFFVFPAASFQGLDLANSARIIIFLFEGICISGLNEALRKARDRAENITSRLRESEEQYRLLVESVKDYAIFGLDAQGFVTSWNYGAELIKGYAAPEIVGKHLSLFYTEADIAQGLPECHLQSAIAAGRFEEEGWRKRKEGTLFWANVLITPLWSETGQLLGFSKVVRDITQQKRSEEALQDSYRLLQTVIEGTGDAIFVKDHQGRYKLVNSGTTKIFGRSREEVLGKDDTELLPADVSAFLRQIDRSVMSTGASRTFEEELPEADGMHTFLTTKDPYRDAQGNIIGVIGIARDITARKQAEATQRQLLKDLTDMKFALDQAAILVMTDAQGVIIDVNDKFCEISKFSRAELIGQTHRIVNSGYHSRSFFRGLWSTITRGQVWQGEIRNRAKDGTLYWVDTTIVPLLDEAGTPFRYFAVRFNITARKQVEEALALEKDISDLERKRLRSILNILPVGVFIANAQGQIVDANPAIQTIWGRSVPMSGSVEDYRAYKGWWSGTNRLLASHEWALARALQEKQTILNEEIDIETFDGQRKTILNSAIPIQNEMGEIINAVAVNVDITQRKQIEASLQKSAHRLETLQQIDRAILQITSPTEIAQAALLRLNQAIAYQQAMVVLFNFETNEAQILAGQVDAKSVGSVLPIYDLSPLESLRQREAVRYIEDLATMLQRPPLLDDLFKQGIRSVLIVALVVENQLIGDLYLLAQRPVAFDLESREIAQEVANQLAIVLQQAQLREQLQRYTEELEQRVAERTAALQDAIEGLEAFNYSASHDLRAPLRSMQGLSQALLEDYGSQLGDTARLYAQEIATSAEQSLRLVAHLLEYGRLSNTNINLQPLDLNKLVADAVTSLQDTLPGRETQVIVENPFPNVIGHRITLTQVILNLLTNAVKFVPGDRQPQIRIWAERCSGWVRLRIRDNGIGIAPEHQKRIFQPFERLHTVEQYPGTGVGLAIVRKGMERMGGHVGVSSTLGQGSCFWVELREAHTE